MVKAMTVTLSDDPADKLQAVLNHDYDDPDSDLGKPYRAACREWFNALSEGERWRLAKVRRAHDDGRIGDAEQLAGVLPPAPRCPL